MSARPTRRRIFGTWMSEALDDVSHTIADISDLGDGIAKHRLGKEEPGSRATTSRTYDDAGPGHEAPVLASNLQRRQALRASLE